jgi:hypothetical protein
MNIEEITKQVQRAESIETKYFFMGFVPLLIYLAYASTPLSSIFPINSCGSISSKNIDLIIRVAVILFVFIFVFFGRKFEKASYPMCPHCLEPINKLNVGVVIATKNCTSCGKLIINS